MTFVFLSTMLWESADGAYAPAQLARELAARGNRVLFIQTFKSDAPVDMGSLPLRVLALDDLGIPNFLVTLSWRGLYLGALDTVFEQLAPIVDGIRAPDEPCVVILNAPFDPLVRVAAWLQARGSYLVYYPQDDYGDMARMGYAEYNLAQEALLVRHADLVITLSGPVAAKATQAYLAPNPRPIPVIPDAVNLDEFRHHAGELPPDTILRGKTATLGFWGTLISSMFDASLLQSVAASQPDWAFNLIGPYDVVPGMPSVYEPLHDLPNVRFLGPIPHARLMQYAAAFDVMLLPGPDNAMSRGRDPLKVYEYLAAYKPIVAAQMPQLQAIPYVWLANSPAQTIAAVQAALQETISRERIDAFLAQHTWRARATALTDAVNQLMTQPPGSQGSLDMALLESLGSAQQMGILSAPEQEVLGKVTKGYYNALTLLEQANARAQQTAESAAQVEAWAQQLQAANLELSRELERINRMFPVKISRALLNKRGP